MSNIIYLKLIGAKQGLISKGASSVDSIGNKFQRGHDDEIFILEMSSQITRDQDFNFRPIEIRKHIDKSSPLISQAITENELLTCEFSFYRTSMSGGIELYYKVSLAKASIVDIHCFYPNTITHNDSQPEESVSIRFESINWEHVISGTSSYAITNQRIF
jgi:type VI secretion system Hcp family effector